MKFEELPHEIQMIAAQTLSNRISGLGVGFTEQTEPVKALAREVRDAFIEMCSQPELALIPSDSVQKVE